MQKNNGFNVVLLDTAGRLQIDDSMMEELVSIRGAVTVDASILVVDAMTGQEAVNVAKTFEDKVGIDGVILTKLDGDTRGGAALSIKAICGKPILYVGMGEKLSDLEQFYPDRMANRILGMGDVLSLIEKAQANIDEEKAREMEQRVRKAQFTYDDYLASMEQMRKMGGIGSILGMMPGIGTKSKEIEDMIDEKDLARKEAIIHSMTPAERANPDLMNPSRKQRIAKGAAWISRRSTASSSSLSRPKDDEADARHDEGARAKMRRFQFSVLNGDLATGQICPDYVTGRLFSTIKTNIYYNGGKEHGS